MLPPPVNTVPEQEIGHAMGAARLAAEHLVSVLLQRKKIINKSIHVRLP